jgi:hypothetical protein
LSFNNFPKLSKHINSPPKKKELKICIFHTRTLQEIESFTLWRGQIIQTPQKYSTDHCIENPKGSKVYTAGIG